MWVACAPLRCSGCFVLHCDRAVILGSAHPGFVLPLPGPPFLSTVRLLAPAVAGWVQDPPGADEQRRCAAGAQGWLPGCLIPCAHRWFHRTHQGPSGGPLGAPPPPPRSASDGPEQGASTTRNRFGGCLPWGRCDPDGAAVPLPYQVLHTRSRGECDVLWQTSPVSIPADLVLWSSGSALTSCIMSRSVHCRLCASAAAARCGTCSDRHCLRVSADTPLTALRGARHAPRSGPWNDMVCVCVCVSVGRKPRT